MAAVLTVPDEHAFAAIVEDHRDELDRHCARLLRSPADAEDALQETFLRAWRSLHTCRSSPRPWLYRIATNVCFDVLGRTPRGARDGGRACRRRSPRANSSRTPS